jgi:hypothetical protein
MGCLVAALVWRSLPWPLVHDAPIMHYVASRIAAGDVPYRDLFDMNMPGVYLLHLAILRTVGAGDFAWRVFDLAWLGAGAGAIATFVAPWGRRAAAAAALLFAAYHLAGGPWQSGQRDFLLSPLLVAGALGVARWAESDAGARPLFSLAWGGLALGAALSVKPHAMLLCAALLALVAVSAGRGALVPGGVFLAAVAALPGALLVWLAAAGGLAAWKDIVFGYLVPVYSALGRPAHWTVYRWHVWIPIALGVVLSAASALLHRRFRARHAVAVIGVAYGLAHYFGQGKGWEYHLYPLAAFATILCFAEVELLLTTRRFALAAPLAASLVAAVVLLGIKGVEASPAHWIWDKEGVVRQLTGDLSERMAAGDLVQVLDTSEGGVHALLRLGARQPTRFLYDFHFFTAPAAPVTAALRAEFIRDFDARPPRFVAVFERGWPEAGYARLERFPELRDRIAHRYELVSWRPAFKLYAERHGS